MNEMGAEVNRAFSAETILGFFRILGRCTRLAMKLRLWRNQSIRMSKREGANLLADQNQNAGYQRQDAGHDHGDTDVKESHDSDKDQIDCEQQHSEVFGDVHAYFLRQRASVCTLKKAGGGQTFIHLSPRRTRRLRRSILL
jgi:hypothetical protein